MTAEIAEPLGLDDTAVAEEPVQLQDGTRYDPLVGARVHAARLRPRRDARSRAPRRTVIGHGGGGPGYSAGAFVLVPPDAEPIVSVVLSAGGDGGAQETALALLEAAGLRTIEPR